jgi:diaminohydroxyphosphoribosylaminopyrimidine deaminase/5-amino-6-(5-phosphoribosylamino)uracil reductase
VAPKLIGGRGASPLAGIGVASLEEALMLREPSVEQLGDDLLIEGDLHWEEM